MDHPFGGADHVSAVHGGQRGFDTAKDHVAAHPGGQVQNHINFGVTHAVGQFTIQLGITRGFAGFRIAYMAMYHGGPGLGGGDGAVGDLLW